MFTGIITGIGHIERVDDLAAGAGFGKRLFIRAPQGYLDDTSLGDSIALNGACMTVESLPAGESVFSIVISAESLDKTSGLAHRGAVNLEKALRAHDRLGGHIVSGHVDGVGEVASLERAGESWELVVHAPPALGRFLAYKGSVAVNGVSLTINRVEDAPAHCAFWINLIPHTMEHTTLGELRAGSRVNLEVDPIARYCERMLSLRLPGQPGA